MKPAWTLGAGLALALLASCGAPTSDRVSLTDLGVSWQVGLNDSAPVASQVPGFVLEDLVRAGLAPDPYTGTHELDVQWVEDSIWTYTTSFGRPRGWSLSDSATLEFQGLNVFSAVEVNDALVLNADNAHRTWTTVPFSVLDTNQLRVTFFPTSKEGQRQLDAFGLALPASNEAKPIGQQVSPFVRKPGYQFGWDWGPRLAGPGIHGDVVLQRQGRAAHPVTFPWVEVVDADSTEARLLTHGWEPDFELELALEGQATDWHRLGDTLVVPSPHLWWPIHMGGQPLYEAIWTHRPSGQIRCERWGLRDLEWVQTPDDHGTSFQLTVHGVPMFARGANVVPPDFHDFTDEAPWLDLVQHAVDANMNMLRVWGGGVYPPTAFFEACDARGILVWQDFMFACAMVPDNPAFQGNVKAEATEQVKRLRHHPSLALWCGNNEVAKAWQTWGWQEMYNLHGQDSARVAEAASDMFDGLLSEVVDEHSAAFYLPTSPTLEKDAGDVHAWGIWFGKESWDHYSRHEGRFASEYGLQSLPHPATLREAGIGAFHDEALQFRQRRKMDWLEPGFDGWDMMRHYMSKTVGAPEQESLETWIVQSQMTQAEGLRQALERHRTSLGRYAGSLYWSMNDVWPAVSWSTVDHAGRWKLGHHAAKRANAPRTVLWERASNDSLRLQAFNDKASTLAGHLAVQCKTLDGIMLKDTTVAWNSLPHGMTRINLGEMRAWRQAPRDSYLTWQWTDASHPGDTLRQSALWDNAVEVNLPECDIDISVSGDHLTIVSSGYVPMAWVGCDVAGRFSDNGMALEPGIPVKLTFSPEVHQIGPRTFRLLGSGQ